METCRTPGQVAEAFRAALLKGDLDGIAELYEEAEKEAGDYAFTQMIFRVSVRPHGGAQAPLAMEARATEVLHRGDDGGWRYLVDHASAPQPTS